MNQPNAQANCISRMYQTNCSSKCIKQLHWPSASAEWISRKPQANTPSKCTRPVHQTCARGQCIRRMHRANASTEFTRWWTEKSELKRCVQKNHHRAFIKESLEHWVVFWWFVFLRRDIKYRLTFCKTSCLKWWSAFLRYEEIQEIWIKLLHSFRKKWRALCCFCTWRFISGSGCRASRNFDLLCHWCRHWQWNTQKSRPGLGFKEKGLRFRV